MPMIALNIATFVICTGMLILFRRIDKSNMKMSKLRRYSSKMFDDFRKLAETEKRKFNDATIEMDILIKKSNALTNNLAQSMNDVEEKLNGLKTENDNLKKVENDINVISNAAQDVNKQIEFIAAAKNDFSNMTDRIAAIQQNLTEVKSENVNLINGFNARLRERSRELMDEFSSVVNARTAEVKEKEEMVTSLKATLNDLENTAFADIKDKSDQMKENIYQAVDKFEHLRDEMFGKVDTEIEKIYGKLKNVEDSVDTSKSDLIDTFQNEVTRVRSEIDNVSIHTIAKKDEIVQAARTEAEDMRKKIEDFKEKMILHENRLVTTADNKISYMESEYQTVSAKFSDMSDKFKNEFAGMEQHLGELKDEIVQYEQQNSVFERTDALTANVDAAITQLNTMLESAHKDAEDVTKFMDEIQDLKELKKTVNNEIRAYQARKEKLEDVEANIHSIMDMSDMAINRMDQLKEDVSKVDFVNSRIDALGQSYSDLEIKIEELKDYEGLITKNLDAANRTEVLMKSVDGKIQNFQKVLDKSDKKVEKVTDHLRDVEEKTLILKTRKNDIQELKDKFDEIDGLGEVMEQRISQIYAMFKKVETLRQEIDDTDSRLQNMFNKTDEKMKEFADFIQSVDADSIISKQVKKDAAPGKNINEHLIKTVRELSERGWSADAIAKKMLLDENSVRFIINTTSI